MQSDCIHSGSGSFSLDDSLASGGVVIFIIQGLSFSELLTSTISLPDGGSTIF